MSPELGVNLWYVPKSFSCITKEGRVSTNLQVANTVELIIEGKSKKGSVIDIDSFVDSKDPIDPSMPWKIGLNALCHSLTQAIVAWHGSLRWPIMARSN